jgi:hypothetical protein
MSRTAKPGRRGKTNTSYLLSGINIKKMVAEELSQLEEGNNISEHNIIKIGRRPIFKVMTKEKEENTTIYNLPNKSFKIRSFTRKLREGNANLKNDDSSEIF